MGAGVSRDPDVSDPGFDEPLLSEDDALLVNRRGGDVQTPSLASTVQQPTYSTMSPQETSSPPREMYPFWVPPMKHDSNRHYHLINVPDHPRPKMGLRAPRPFVIYDYILSALILAVAMQLIRPSLEHISLQAIIGAVLFQAGLVTAVMAFYAIFRSCGRRFLRWEDILTAIALGLSLYLTKMAKQPWLLPATLKTGTWQLFVGISLLEAVIIYMLSRGMFILSTKDDAIDMLVIEVDSLQQSIAVGLAEAYYLDFVRDVGEMIKRNKGYVRVSYQNPVEARGSAPSLIDDLYVPCIFMTIPRYLDWREGSPTRQRKESYIRSGGVLTCHVEGSGDSNAPWLCITGIPLGYVLDLSPRPLQIIIDDIRANPTFSDDQKRTEQYQKEINRFSHRLAWLVMRGGLENHFKILEFEDEIMPYIPLACNEVMKGLPNVAHGLVEATEIPSEGELGQPDVETGGC